MIVFKHHDMDIKNDPNVCTKTNVLGMNSHAIILKNTAGNMFILIVQNARMRTVVHGTNGQLTMP